MRTAKKTLCLVLVLAMMLGMCVFASADVTKAEDYADYEDIAPEYKQAAAILTALKVLKGYEEDSKLHGEELLKRGEGAAIICRLLGYDESMSPANVTPFSDMEGHWSRSYVNACVQRGIIAGFPDGTFRPEDQLTGTQFAKMLLAALGYNAEKEGLVGDGWDVNTAIIANSADSKIIPNPDVYGPFPYTEQINRYTAAQMAFTTLLMPLVNYSGDTRNFDTTSNRANQTISSAVTNDNLFMVEFAERYFPGLVRDTHAGDDFGTPVTSWKLNNKLIIETPNANVFSTTEPVTGKEISDLYGGKRLGDNVDENNLAVTLYFDGVEVDDDVLEIAEGIIEDYIDEDDIWTAIAEDDTLTAKQKAETLYAFTLYDAYTQIDEGEDEEITEPGTEVSVYVDNDSYAGTQAGSTGGAGAVSRSSAVTIVIKHAWLAEVKSVTADDSRLMVMQYPTGDNHAGIAYKEVSKDITGDVKDDDYLIVNITNPWEIVDTKEVDKAVAEAAPAVVATDVAIDAYTIDGWMDTATIGGEKHEVAEMAYTDKKIVNNNDEDDENPIPDLSDNEFTVYCDEAGYVYGIEENAGASSYVFITGYHANGSNLGGSTYEVNAIFPDGTFVDHMIVKAEDTANDLLSDATVQAIGRYLENKEGSPVLNTWFECDVTRDDDGKITECTLTDVVADQSATVKYAADDDEINADNNAYYIGGETYVIGDDATQYIVANATDDVRGGAIYGVDKVATGYKDFKVTVMNVGDPEGHDWEETNTPAACTNNFEYMNDENAAVAGDLGVWFYENREQYADTYFVYDGNYVVCAVIISADDDGGDAEKLYVINAGKGTTKINGKDYKTLNVIRDGEIDTVYIKADKVGDIDDAGFYSVVFDEDGNVTKVNEKVDVTASDKLGDVGDDGYFFVGTGTYKVTEDTKGVLGIQAVEEDEEGDQILKGDKVQLNLSKDDVKFFLVNVADADDKGEYDEAYSAGALIDDATAEDGDQVGQIVAVYAEVDDDGYATTVIVHYEMVPLEEEV